MATAGQVTLAVFKDFFLAKAYDVVGNGTYRKHLSRCKDGGDPWAVDMSSNIQCMQAHIKEITSAVHAMPQTSNRLHEICKDVMMSAQPPIKLHAGCVTCCVTDRKCMKCIDLSKTHKSTSGVFVDARFCYFFMLLWYCNKLEYVIRSFTRTWLDSRPEDDTYRVICASLHDEMAPKIASMHRLFVVAKTHIMRTLETYANAHKLSLFLNLQK